jgi:hypothetical protein
MCVASTAKRRRRQAKNSFKHLAIHGPNKPRPMIRKHSSDFYANKLASNIATLKRIALNKARSKK